MVEASKMIRAEARHIGMFVTPHLGQESSTTCIYVSFDTAPAIDDIFNRLLGVERGLFVRVDPAIDILFYLGVIMGNSSFVYN